MTDTKASDVWLQGPVNGMGERDPSGPYVRVVMEEKGGARHPFLISIGAAEVFAAELDAFLGRDE